MKGAILTPQGFALPDYMATGAKPTLPFPNTFWTNTVPGTPIKKGYSSQVVSQFVSQATLEYGQDNDTYPTVNPYPNNGISRYVVAGNSIKPWTTVAVDTEGNWSGPQGTETFPIPAGACTKFQTNDQKLVVWDTDNNRMLNCWVYDPLRYCWTQQIVPTGSADSSYSGFGPWSGDPLGSTTAASGGPYGAGVITVADILYGAIDHVMSVTVGHPTTWWIPPAIYSDAGGGYDLTNGVPYGCLLVMPSSVPMPDYSGSNNPAFARMFFTALQTYGMVPYDQSAGGGVVVAVENSVPWLLNKPSYNFPVLDYTTLNGTPWNEMEVIVPTSQMGSGGSGSSNIPTGGYTSGNATVTPATVTLPTTIQSGDTLLLFMLLRGQGYNPATPTGWTLLGSSNKAGNQYAVYKKTATSGDSGATLNVGFAGSGFAWNAIDVNGSSGATLITPFNQNGFIPTAPATLGAGQNLTILWVACNNNTSVTLWPDGYTSPPGAWTQTSPWSYGFGVFPGAAYSDAFVPNYATTCVGLEVAV